MYLGVEGVLARSFARIHKANLFNFGIVPLEVDAADYEAIEQGDDIEIVDDVDHAVRSGQEEFTVRVDGDWELTASLDASEREREILADGGKLSHTKKHAESGGDSSAPADD